MENNYRSHIVFACISMAVAVSLGAIAAHILKEHTIPSKVSSFLTGVRYQAYHSIAILVLVSLFQQRGIKVKWPLLIMEIGMILFSVSIYLLSTRSIFFHEDSFGWLGPLTPVGGLMLITAWIMIAIAFLKK